MLLLSPLLYVGAFHNPSALPRYALLAAVTAAAWIALAVLALRRQVSVLIHPLQLPALLYLLWASLSLGWAVEHGNSIIDVVQLWGLVAVFLLATQLADGATILKLAVLSVAAASLAA